MEDENLRVVPRDARTLPIHSTGPHILHQTPPATRRPLICILGRAPGCDIRLEEEWFARTLA